MKLSAKVTILATVLGAIVVLSIGYTVVTAMGRYRENANLVQNMSVVDKIGDFVHAIQIERAASSKFLGASTPENREQLSGVRKQVDETMAAAEAALKHSHLKGKYENGKMVDSASIRGQIDASQIEAPESAKWFTATIKDLLDFIDMDVVSKTNNRATLIQAQAAVSFMKAKENAGQERAHLLPLLKKDAPIPTEALMKWGALIRNQDNFLGNYKRMATDELLSDVQALEASTEFKEVEDIRTKVKELASKGGFGIAPSEWFDKTTRRIDRMKTTEKQGLLKVIEVAEKAKSAERNAVLFMITLLVVTMVVIVIVVKKVLISIKGPLEGIQKFMLDVSQTMDFGSRVTIGTRDEIGQTGEVLNAFLGVLQSTMKEINSVMEAMSMGSLGQRVEIEVAGDLNTLKLSINNTADTLQSAVLEVNTVMSAMMVGDLSSRVTLDVEGDFQVLRDGINTTAGQLQTVIGEINRVMAAMAEGDLSKEVAIPCKGELDSLKQSINRTIHSLSETIGTLSTHTKKVAESSSEASRAVQQVSDGSQNQLLSIEQIAKAIEQTVLSVTDVTRNAEMASQHAKTATDVVEKSKTEMSHMQSVITGISENSSKINKITDVIGEIASQTNLLALNAAIEAARAGEHGKGFAVVAEEVRKLAENSANSVHEITELVTQAVHEAERGVKTNETVSANMVNVAQAVIQTDEMLQRIAAAMEETSASMEQVSANVSSLRNVGESNASASEEITATIVELSSLAAKSRHAIEKFTV